MRHGVLMVCWLAACGAGNSRPDGGRSDASRADAAADGNPDTVAVGTAQVLTYTRNGALAPQPGLTVWSSHPDGSVDEENTSDADGMATLHIESGGAVTVVYGAGAQTNLETVLDVRPGDVLRFGTYGGDTLPITGTITLQWPSYPTAGQYLVTNGRFGQVLDFNATSSQLLFDDSVPNPIDLVVHAYSDSGDLIAVAHLLDTTMVDGATYTFTEWRPAISHTITVDGVPAALPIGDLFAQFYTVNTQDIALGGYTGAVGQDIGADHALHITTPASDYSTTFAVYGDATEGNGGSRGIQFFVRAPVPASGPITVTLDPPSIFGSPVYDPTARRGTWTRDTVGVDDMITFVINSYPNGLPAWTIRAPGDRTEVFFPEAPAGQVDLPTGSLTVSASADNEQVPTTYAEIKAAAEWELGVNTFGAASYSASQVFVYPP